MNTLQFAFFITTLSILCASCTKELRYTKEELYKIATRADPTVTFILPNSLTEGVNCADYSEGCHSAHIVSVQKLELIAVEFASETAAIYAAKKFKGFYVRNWMLDDVTGEPVLEKFVQEKLGAKKP